MRLKSTYITHESGREQLLVDSVGAFSGLIRSNKTAAFIVDCLKEDTTEEKIIEAILEKYDVQREVVQEDVAMIIEKLESIGAIEK